MATAKSKTAKPVKAKRRPRKSGSWALRILKWIIYLILLSLFWVVALKFVPPPVTITMLMDPNGISKDWTRLGNIDRNMVRAVIAAEDSKFCSHEGFDGEAITTAIKRNLDGDKLRGGSTISSKPPKMSFCGRAADGPAMPAKCRSFTSPS